MIEFKLSGDVSPKHMPLAELATSLSEFGHIVDKAYLVATKQKRFTKKNRDDCYLVSTGIRDGSYITDLAIVMVTTSGALPNLTTFSPKDLWELVKNAYDFLKSYSEMMSKGQNVSVSLDHTNVNAPMIIGDNNTVIVGANIAEIADRSEGSYKSITSIIKKKGITKISAFNDDTGIKIGVEEKLLFNPASFLDKELVTLKCDIVRFDKENKKGRLEIKNFASGSYKFKSLLISPSPIIKAMELSEVTIEAYIEYAVHSTGVKSIASFHIWSIQETENTLFK